MAASVWRGKITFGLVSIPVRLVKAARRERTRFRRLQRLPGPDSEIEDDFDIPKAPVQSPRVLEFPATGKASIATSPPSLEDPAAQDEQVVRVRNAPINALTEVPVRPAEILKGYEVSKDEFVVLAPEEVAALRPRTSSELEITEFVRVEEIDPVYYETSYYVVPDAGGEKAYTLLFATLKETGYAGMGSLAMHGREHVALIRAGREALVLHSMFYANEVGRGVPGGKRGSESKGAGTGKNAGRRTRGEVRAGEVEGSLRGTLERADREPDAGGVGGRSRPHAGPGSGGRHYGGAAEEPGNGA